MEQKNVRKPGRPPKFKDKQMINLLIERDELNQLDELTRVWGLDSRGDVLNRLLLDLPKDQEMLIAENEGLKRQVKSLQEELAGLRGSQEVGGEGFSEWDVKCIEDERVKVLGQVRLARVPAEMWSGFRAAASVRADVLCGRMDGRLSVGEYVGLLDVWEREHDEKEKEGD